MAKHRDRSKVRFLDRYGPWAVITGASSGIGREIALGLAKAGLDLVLVARRREVLEQMAADLGARHKCEVRVAAVDLSSESALETVEKQTSDLDVGLLVAAAGFGTSGPFLQSSLEEEFEMLELNCRAPLRMALHYGRRFARRGRGGIVLMSSIVGFQGTPNAAHYAATKAYVQTLAEALHVELAPLGVDVLASSPGPTASGFAARAGMHIRIALEPAAVAESTLKALGRTATVLPGALSKLLAYSLASLPRLARVRILGRVMGGMVKQGRTSGAFGAPRPSG